MRAQASVRIAIATVVLVTGISGRVAAAPITLANPSFEDNVLTDGSTIVGADNWTHAVFGAANGAASWNPSGFFTGDSGNGTPQGALGCNVFTIYGGNASSGGRLSQNTTTPLTADTTYTLTIAVGRRSSGDGGSWGIDLMTTSQTPGSAYLARLTGTYTDLTSGQFVDKVVTCTPTADHPNLGQNLKVHFWSQGIDGTHASTAFDNVRLDATAGVPAPPNTRFDDFAADPNITTYWTQYSYFGTENVTPTWNSTDRDLDLAGGGVGGLVLGLYRTSASRSATDTVKLTVKDFAMSGGNWGYVALMISAGPQPTLTSGANRYEFRIIKNAGVFSYQVLPNNGTDLIVDTPTATFSGPVTLQIVRNGANYDFKVNGSTLATGSSFTSAQHDAMVYYEILFGGDVGITATVDDFGVLTLPQGTVISIR